MPRRRSIDLKATACSRLRVKRENFQTRISSKGAVLQLGFVQHPAELGPVGDPARLGLVGRTRARRGSRGARRSRAARAAGRRPRDRRPDGPRRRGRRALLGRGRNGISYWCSSRVRRTLKCAALLVRNSVLGTDGHCGQLRRHEPRSETKRRPQTEADRSIRSQVANGLTHCDAVVVLSGVEVLGVDRVAARHLGGGDDRGVPVRDSGTADTEPLPGGRHPPSTLESPQRAGCPRNCIASS